MTAAQLRRAYIPPTKWMIEGLLPEGVTILAGRPKVGKSWFIMDMAQSIANGTSFLEVGVEQGDVLHLALEDGWNRLKGRIKAMDGKANEMWPDCWVIKTHSGRFDDHDGGLDEVEQWVRGVANPRLIIVDTFAYVKPSGNLRKNPYDLDVEAMKPLSELAKRCRLAIVLIFHVRKAGSDDVFETISGTMGMQGTADTLMVLDRVRGNKDNMATLRALGRDMEEIEWPMTLVECRWQRCDPDDPEAALSEQERRVLHSMSNDPMSPKRVAEASGLPGNRVSTILKRMHEKGAVERVGRGAWRKPPVAEKG